MPIIRVQQLKAANTLVLEIGIFTKVGFLLLDDHFNGDGDYNELEMLTNTHL